MDQRIPSLSELKKLMLVINPVSGKRAASRNLSDIIRIFSSHGYAVTVFPTAKPGDATEFVINYSDGFDLVVCIGGDGTLNEVLTGILRGEKDVPLGYIPSGSTNDFAACHGISSDMCAAAEAIACGKPHEIDLGKFGDRCFSYVAAFGMFSWLSYTTSQNLKNKLGHSAYLLDAIKDLPKIKANHLRLTVDGFTCEGDYIFGAVCNSTSVAGTITLPSDVVDTSDGIFEVLLVHEPRTIFDFQNIIIGVLTQDYSSPFLDFFQAHSVKIEAPSDMEWTLDGERGEPVESVDVENLNRRIKLIY